MEYEATPNLAYICKSWSPHHKNTDRYLDPAWVLYGETYVCLPLLMERQCV